MLNNDSQFNTHKNDLPVRWPEKATKEDLEKLMELAQNYMIYTRRYYDKGKTIEYHDSIEEAIKEKRIGSVWVKLFHPSINDNPIHPGWKLVQVIDETGNPLLYSEE